MNRLIFILVLALTASVAWARGGGGCLAQGTPIATPAGEVAIERLRPGDAVWTLAGESRVVGKVAAVTRVEAEQFVELSIEGQKLLATPEHPFRLGPGRFKAASALQAGESLRLFRGGALRPAKVDSVRLLDRAAPAYNLLVTPAGVYLAQGVAVHNKGCFLPDTPILRADGSEVPIAAIRPGDVVLSFTPQGKTLPARVREVLTHEVEEYCEVSTESAALRVTAEHPFYVGAGEFRTVEALRVGDRVGVYAGEGLSFQRIIGITRVAGHTRVYNLQTDEPHTYFAHGVAVHNKGGGGCFVAGTRVATPAGPRAIESIRPGESVTAFDADGQTFAATVRKTFVHAVPATLCLTIAGRQIVTTAEHPISTGGGAFTPAGLLRVGDSVALFDGQRWSVRAVEAIDHDGAAMTVYNLEVDGPHTFIAEGVGVHNKGGGGGCFVAGTPVMTPAGPVAIEMLRPSDTVVAFGPDGAIVAAAVRRTFAREVPATLALRIDGRTLVTTEEHPIGTAPGGFVPAGRLRVGDLARIWERDGWRSARVEQIERRQSTTTVHNLEVDGPHTYIAGAVAVHNKGGGWGGYHGFGSSRGSSSSTQPSKPWSQMTFWEKVFEVLAMLGIVLLGLFIVAAIVIGVLNPEGTEDGGDVRMLGFRGGSRELDHLHPGRDIARKANPTTKLAEGLSAQDPLFAPETLRETARSTFRQLQSCWQARDYGPMRTLMMPDLLLNHVKQIESMKRRHEINVISGIDIQAIHIVNVRFTTKPDEREFTALIAARARDYYVDDRTNAFRRGDRTPSPFQEFWTFQQSSGVWRLRDIEQARESTVLRDENEVEGAAPDALAAMQAGGEFIPPSASRGGLLARPGGNGAEELIDALRRTNPQQWNRQRMKDRVRDVFMRVHLARESGSIDAVPAGDLTSDAAEALRAEITAMVNAGQSVEYANLCVRRVELVLVRNYKDNRKDSFCARVTAHAQKIVRRGEQVVSQQPDVTAFTEFWEFIRTTEGWAMRSAGRLANPDAMLREGNVDEDRVMNRFA